MRKSNLARNADIILEASTVTELLKIGSLSPHEAEKRARLLIEDFNWINFEELRLAAESYLYRDSVSLQISSLPIPEYYFGDTNFDINNAENGEKNEATWFGGTGLDRGHLQALSKVSVIARKMIPHYWHKDKTLRSALRNPPQHLDTVEEVWWLDRWLGADNIEISSQLIPGSNKDVDWRFRLGNQIHINLEVKRIPSDCVRHARGLSFNTNWFGKFCEEKVMPKYRPSNAEEINVLAISLFGELDRSVQDVISVWLRQQSLIDGIVIWTRESRHSANFDLQSFSPKALLLRQFLNPPDEEDISLAFGLKAPMKLPVFPI